MTGSDAPIRICCIGAGYVGGPTYESIALLFLMNLAVQLLLKSAQI